MCRAATSRQIAAPGGILLQESGGYIPCRAVGESVPDLRLGGRGQRRIGITLSCRIPGVGHAALPDLRGLSRATCTGEHFFRARLVSVAGFGATRRGGYLPLRRVRRFAIARFTGQTQPNLRQLQSRVAWPNALRIFLGLVSQSYQRLDASFCLIGWDPTAVSMIRRRKDCLCTRSSEALFGARIATPLANWARDKAAR